MSTSKHVDGKTALVDAAVLFVETERRSAAASAVPAIGSVERGILATICTIIGQDYTTTDDVIDIANGLRAIGKAEIDRRTAMDAFDADGLIGVAAFFDEADEDTSR